MNIGEEICGEWLRHAKHCEFVQYNLQTPDVQGEIDVIGINLSKRIVYACEVAVHLITGLQYVKNCQPDNVPRLTGKFSKAIQYVRKIFPDYAHEFMLWSPVVRNQATGSKHNQTRDVQAIVEAMTLQYGVVVEPIINEKFQTVLEALREIARCETKELDSRVMRLFQVEEHLRHHLEKAKRL